MAPTLTIKIMTLMLKHIKLEDRKNLKVADSSYDAWEKQRRQKKRNLQDYSEGI